MAEVDPHALKAADPVALDALYRAWAGTVLNWVIRLGGPWLDAPDVAHDVFATAFARAHTFRVDGKPGAWLFGITRRVVANARRRSALRRFVGLDRVAPPAAPGPDAVEVAHQRWRRFRLQQALDLLPVAQREVLVVVHLEQRSAVEAAALLGVPVGTVYSRLHHARRRFRAALEAELGPDAADQLGLLEVS